MRRPTNCVLFLIALCLVWAVSPTPLAAQYDLRCENAVNPRGVKALQPQLSWALNSALMQRAYQVLVATSEEKLKADEGDLWDSGIVRSDQKTVRYQGRPLSPLQRCYWKVRVWDTYYQATFYSDPASWEMGALLAQSWAAAPALGSVAELKVPCQAGNGRVASTTCQTVEVSCPGASSL